MTQNARRRRWLQLEGVRSGDDTCNRGSGGGVDARISVIWWVVVFPGFRYKRFMGKPAVNRLINRPYEMPTTVRARC